MNLLLNGQEHKISAGMTIGQLLVSLNLEIDRVVIELNRNILSTADNINTELQDGDSLEIIQFVGGG